MTNEEIRLNQYCKHCRNYDKGCGWLCRGRICNEADAYEMALDEKDQQFKEYLEKKIEPYIRTNVSPQGTYQEGFEDGYTSAINEIINELFGE